MRRLWLFVLLAAGCKESQTPGAAPADATAQAPATAPTVPIPDTVREVLVPRIPLFAADVALDTLPLTIGIETLGGVSSPVLERGTALPATFRDVFSTSADNQDQVELHLTMGQRPLARDQRTLGKYVLAGIPPASRGMPQIEVTFAVDAKGVLTVSAVEKSSGSQTVVRSAATPAPLTRAQVDEILADARAHAATDGVLADWTAARNALDMAVYEGRQFLTLNIRKLSTVERERVETALQDAGRVLLQHAEPGDPGPLADAEKALASVLDGAQKEIEKR